MNEVTEEGFHEIQLNGKQLVFLFMLTAIVLVATFLMGVGVGRGVKADRPVDGAMSSRIRPYRRPRPRRRSRPPPADRLPRNRPPRRRSPTTNSVTPSASR